MSYSHCLIWTPSDAARLFGACEKNVAVRHRDIALAGLPFSVWAVLEFVKQFLSSKIRSRLSTYGDVARWAEAKLGEGRAQEVLPEELGGKGGTIKVCAITMFCVKNIYDKRL